MWYKLCSMSLLIAPEYLLTIINLVVEFLPGTSISKPFEHILLRVLRLFHNLPQVFGDRICMLLPPAEEKTHLSWPIRSVSLNAVCGMTFHIKAPSSDLFQRIFSFVWPFSSASLVVVNFWNHSVLGWAAWGLTSASLCVQPKSTSSINGVGSSTSMSFC